MAAWIRALGLFATIITEIVAGTVAGILLGYGAEKYLGWPRELMLITGLAGFGLGLYRVIAASTRLWKDTDQENETRK